LVFHYSACFSALACGRVSAFMSHMDLPWNVWWHEVVGVFGVMRLYGRVMGGCGEGLICSCVRFGVGMRRRWNVHVATVIRRVVDGCYRWLLRLVCWQILTVFCVGYG
jgi:hypothetical protein